MDALPVPLAVAVIEAMRDLRAVYRLACRSVRVYECVLLALPALERHALYARVKAAAHAHDSVCVWTEIQGVVHGTAMILSRRAVRHRAPPLAHANIRVAQTFHFGVRHGPFARYDATATDASELRGARFPSLTSDACTVQIGCYNADTLIGSYEEYTSDGTVVRSMQLNDAGRMHGTQTLTAPGSGDLHVIDYRDGLRHGVENVYAQLALVRTVEYADGRATGREITMSEHHGGIERVCDVIRTAHGGGGDDTVEWLLTSRFRDDAPTSAVATTRYARRHGTACRIDVLEAEWSDAGGLSAVHCQWTRDTRRVGERCAVTVRHAAHDIGGMEVRVQCGALSETTFIVDRMCTSVMEFGASGVRTTFNARVSDVSIVNVAQIHAPSTAVSSEDGPRRVAPSVAARASVDVPRVIFERHFAPVVAGVASMKRLFEGARRPPVFGHVLIDDPWQPDSRTTAEFIDAATTLLNFVALTSADGGGGVTLNDWNAYMWNAIT